MSGKIPFLYCQHTYWGKGGCIDLLFYHTLAIFLFYGDLSLFLVERSLIWSNLVHFWRLSWRTHSWKLIRVELWRVLHGQNTQVQGSVLHMRWTSGIPTICSIYFILFFCSRVLTCLEVVGGYFCLFFPGRDLGSKTWILLFYLRRVWASTLYKWAPPIVLVVDGSRKQYSIGLACIEDLVMAMWLLNFLLMSGIPFFIYCWFMWLEFMLNAAAIIVSS